MDRKKLSIRLALLILFIFIANLAAMKFYWYYAIWWLDMPMHFFGGLWLGLASLWFFSSPNSNFTLSTTLMLKVMLGVLLVGVSWELFEVLVNNFSTQNAFDSFDVASDICFDLAGGFFATFYILRRTKNYV